MALGNVRDHIQCCSLSGSWQFLALCANGYGRLLQQENRVESMRNDLAMAGLMPETFRFFPDKPLHIGSYWTFCLIHLNDGHYTVKESVKDHHLTEAEPSRAKKEYRYNHGKINVGNTQHSSAQPIVQIVLHFFFSSAIYQTHILSHLDMMRRIKQICIYCILDKYGG